MLARNAWGWLRGCWGVQWLCRWVLDVTRSLGKIRGSEGVDTGYDNSCTYMSKASTQVVNDVQNAARSHVPAPIILEILDNNDEQLTAKVKQQQAELKKVMDAVEHAWE